MSSFGDVRLGKVIKSHTCICPTAAFPLQQVPVHDGGAVVTAHAVAACCGD